MVGVSSGTFPLSPSILAGLETYWQVRPQSFEQIQGTSGLAYRIQTDSEPVILRLTLMSERSLAWLEAEMTLIFSLQDQGFGVSCPRLSSENTYIHPLEGYYAVIFDLAEGRHIPYSDHLWWHPLHLVELGQVIARLHLATQAEPLKALERPDWTLLWPCPGLDVWPEESEKILRWQALAEILDQKRSSEFWGLIHGEIQPGNLLITENGQVTLLDFNQACYHWLGADIAIALSYYLIAKGKHPKQLRMFRSKFIQAILEGYRNILAFPPEEESLLEPCFEWVCLQQYFYGLHYLQVQGVKLTPQVRNMLANKFILQF